MDGEYFSTDISRAKLNLICLPQELVLDLPSAPRLCFQNISRREVREKEKNEHIFTRTFLDRCIFNSQQADEGTEVAKWWKRRQWQRLPVIFRPD